MTNFTHIQRRGTTRRTLCIALAAVAAAALAGTSAVKVERAPTVTLHIRNAIVPAPATAAPTSATARTTTRPYSYGWPLKPFDRQHPIRGYFDDPRTIFKGEPTPAGLLTSDGAFSFHQGIDIAAPDGTRVYPVVDGVVKRVAFEWINVESGNGVSFQYWHLDAAVQAGDHVTARETVLGRIKEGSEHVHLTQLVNHRPVNPLAPGNIGPYVDRTIPRVGEIAFRATDGRTQLLPEYLHGRVELVAAASDMPAKYVPGLWRGLPVSPARVTWHVRDIRSGRIVIRERNARDVRRTLPQTTSLWFTYARGSHMNMPQFANHRYWRQPGVYLFKLTPDALDTRRLHDGIYEVVVTAWDTAGNRSSGSRVFSVHNDPHWLDG